ncbi:transporter substrate-binding domain-containing protein [Sphingomonas naphthae]|uniref:Transporter substrate-binding domain-containing protein n=1 Tax=Sphingomonas naphthae TaxID=1813468 RepID=A0ABY7TJS5_9SPHN|nr:transporter substrate-binding domain-containing protein [Sphingomonas naphthae]WCT73206.1 transporter substrate-binding domain-containing protein [Sphingomonas naphthae]
MLRSISGGVMAALLLAGAAPAAAAPLDKVKKTGFLRVAVYKDFAPWAYRKDGRLVGIDVDIANALAAKLGVKTDMVDFLADEDVDGDLRNMVWRGTLIGQAPADVMMHVPADRTLALRNDRVAIVAPYYREAFAMVCDPDQADCEAPPPQFKGKTIYAELDSVPDFYLSGSFGGVLRGDVTHVPTGAEAVAAVSAGKAAMAVATRAQVENGLGEAPGKAVLRKGPLPAISSPGWNVAVAVKDDSRDLGDEIETLLADMQKSGELDAIFARYHVVPRAPLLR